MLDLMASHFSIILTLPDIGLVGINVLKVCEVVDLIHLFALYRDNFYLDNQKED